LGHELAGRDHLLWPEEVEGTELVVRAPSSPVLELIEEKFKVLEPQSHIWGGIRHIFESRVASKEHPP
jgi:hypothetical protein